MVALAALREWRPEERRQEPGRLDPITSLPNRRQFQTDAAFWGNARATLVLITLADAQAFNEILRVLGHARSDAFIRAGAAAADRDPRPGHRDLPRQHPELRLPPARPRRARPAGDDRRASSTGFRAADPLRRRADRHAHRHRAQGARPRQPGRGPARHALGGAGQPQLAQRLGLVRPQERRGAPPRLPAPVGPQARARRRRPARAALPAEGDARHRRLRQRRGAAALDPPAARPGLARRVRRARRDDRAGHADDPLGDRRRDPAGGDLGARGARHVARGQRLAEEPRGAGLRRVPALLLRRPRRSTGRGSSSRSPRASAPPAAG